GVGFGVAIAGAAKAGDEVLELADNSIELVLGHMDELADLQRHVAIGDEVLEIAASNRLAAAKADFPNTPNSVVGMSGRARIEIALGRDIPGGGYKELAKITGASRWQNWARDGVTRRTLHRFG